MKLSSYKQVGIKTEALVLVYHWNIEDGSELLLDMKKKFEHLEVNTSIKSNGNPMRFIDACRSKLKYCHVLTYS